MRNMNELRYSDLGSNSSNPFRTKNVNVRVAEIPTAIEKVRLVKWSRQMCSLSLVVSAN